MQQVLLENLTATASDRYGSVGDFLEKVVARPDRYLLRELGDNAIVALDQARWFEQTFRAEWGNAELTCDSLEYDDVTLELKVTSVSPTHVTSVYCRADPKGVTFSGDIEVLGYENRGWVWRDASYYLADAQHMYDLLWFWSHTPGDSFWWESSKDHGGVIPAPC